ncbi:MAG: response regulator [Eubacteriales bacterium]
MFDLIIADDENKIRLALKKLIPWNTLNISLVCECSTGDDLLQQTSIRKPHIIITDMKMPGKHGESLLKELRKINSNVKIIILSGYDDFAFIRQAVVIDAIDYLLKPVDPLELEKILTKTVNLCIKENILTQKQTSQTQEKYINELLSHKCLDFDSFYNQMGLIDTPTMTYGICVLNFYTTDGYPNSIASEVAKELLLTINNTSFCVVTHIKNSFSLLLLVNTSDYKQANFLLEKKIEPVLTENNLHFIIGVGSFSHDILNLPESYHEALITISCAPITLKTSLLFENCNMNSFYGTLNDEKTERFLRNFAESGNLSLFKTTLPQFYNELILDDSTCLFRLKQCNHRMILLISHLLYRINSSTHFHKELDLIRPFFLEIVNPNLNCDILTSFLNKLDLESTPLNNTKFQTACEIRTYLELHYCEKITLTSLSEYFFLTKPYLSKIFKDYFSIGIFDYLDILRIEHAKKLLATGNTMRQITDAVGYYDESHFDRKFKKITGMSPKNYK